MEYDWYADLFFLEEVYRDVLILWLAAVLMRRRAEVLRLLGAGIAGGLCSTGSVYLELMGRYPAGGQPVFAGIWEVWKLLVTGFLMIWRFLDESFEVAREGTGSPDLIRRDFAEWAGDSAGAVFSYRLEKSDVYGIFLYGSSFLGGSSCEAADDRENTVSGPSFLK